MSDSTERPVIDFGPLHQFEEDHDVVVLGYTRAQIEQDLPRQLTDDEWRQVRRNFHKADREDDALELLISIAEDFTGRE